MLCEQGCANDDGRLPQDFGRMLALEGNDTANGLNDALNTPHARNRNPLDSLHLTAHYGNPVPTLSTIPVSDDSDSDVEIVPRAAPHSDASPQVVKSLPQTDAEDRRIPSCRLHYVGGTEETERTEATRSTTNDEMIYHGGVERASRSLHQFPDFSCTEDWLGSGSFGVVYRTQCINCERQFAKKVIYIDEISQADRQEHIRATERELFYYQSLRHPHVVDYVHHERTDSKVSVYTEYCRLKDLQRLLFKADSDDRDLKLVGEEFAWDILEALASALSRCHMGLNATKENGSVLEYTGFEDGWKTILHRDIKPANILLAVYTSPGDGDKLIAKLGDFGSSLTLSDQAPSSRPAGTRDYWSTELAEEAKTEARTTKWSMQSDIWAVGAVIHRMLTKTTPKQEQEKDFEPRLNIFKSKVTSAGKSVSRLLSHIVTFCIDPSPERRPSALQLLSVAVTRDSSSSGRLRSESLWAAVSKHPKWNVTSSVVEKFAADFLPLLAESQTQFSPKEVVSIISVIKEHYPGLISGSHSQLCTELGLAGGTVFHAVASLTPEDAEKAFNALETSRGDRMTEMLKIALKKDGNGLLPSEVAALQKNFRLSVQLKDYEDMARSIVTAFAQQNLLDDHKSMEQSASNDFEIMFELLTSGACSFPS